MSKTKLIQAMKKTLDGNAQNYMKFSTVEVKEIYKKAFQNEVFTMNMLLENMYKKNSVNDIFTSSITVYIDMRERENWQ